MDYVQERISTLHDLTGRVPDAPVDETAVVLPMTGEEYSREATARIVSVLSELSPNAVLVPLRAERETASAVAEWLDSFDCNTELLWCNSPRVSATLDHHGIDGPTGKGRDVWLALGRASTLGEYIVVHDADIEHYDQGHVPRLCSPLASGFSFVKGYYARVEDDTLYGRLLRLFYEPVARALAAESEEPVLEYLTAFRYALAGDIGLTADFARQLRIEPSWGLEVGLLGEAFRHAGFEGTAQVDLGTHEHDHRPVNGGAGLATMSREVGAALFRTLSDSGVEPDYDTLPTRYGEQARRLVEQYAADAEFNGLTYDRDGELDQIDTYQASITPPGTDNRLPAWNEVDLDPADIAAGPPESVPTNRQ